MCGIAGAVALDPRRPVEGDRIRKMLACLRHRGPDDEGSFVGDGVALGHRRLSIIDLEHGHQPLRGASPHTLIVANGEIYNYRELRRELEGLGHTFRTRSDSEVAAFAYDAWGLDFLGRLDGMFALAIWDGARRRLVLARDRMGEKPLFYGSHDGLLLFASELRALVAYPGFPRRLDHEALSQYLCLEYVPAPGSLIEGVRKLEPGTAIVVEDGRIEGFRFWEPTLRREASPRRAIPGFPAAARQMRTVLEDAVGSRLVSDVPLGVFLSGGIDSSVVAALAARHGPVDTFSIGFEEPSFDESKHARLVAAAVGSRHHEHVVAASEMPAVVPRLGELLDEPIGDASFVPTTLLCRFARESVKVVLGGDGGDELFGGYPMHRAHRVSPFVDALPSGLHDAARAVAELLPVTHGNFTPRFKLLSFLRGAGSAPPANHVYWMSSFTPAEQRRVLHPDLVSQLRPEHSALVPMETAWARSEGAETLLRAMHLDASTYLPNNILTKVDRASMSVGLEVRAPFLHPAVVDLCFGLPSSYHMTGLRGKRLLREAARGLVPPAILRRPKKGFGMPVAAWLQGSLAPLVGDVLAPDALRQSGLFDPQEVSRLLREHRQARADHRKPLWTLLVFELWRRDLLGAGGL